LHRDHICVIVHDKMKRAVHKQRFVLWGIVIGGSLGFLESAVSIRLWHEFGSPDFLVRYYMLEEQIIMKTTAGVLFGIIFGILVCGMSRRLGMSIRFFPFYLSLMLSGFFLYAVQYLVILKFRLPLWFIGDVILFVGGLALVQAFMKKENTRLTGE